MTSSVQKVTQNSIFMREKAQQLHSETSRYVHRFRLICHCLSITSSKAYMPNRSTLFCLVQIQRRSYFNIMYALRWLVKMDEFHWLKLIRYLRMWCVSWKRKGGIVGRENRKRCFIISENKNVRRSPQNSGIHIAKTTNHEQKRLFPSSTTNPTSDRTNQANQQLTNQQQSTKRRSNNQLTKVRANERSERTTDLTNQSTNPKQRCPPAFKKTNHNIQVVKIMNAFCLNKPQPHAYQRTLTLSQNPKVLFWM